MSVDTPPESENLPALRREALLPNERSRGLGTVAVVCTMAGVASGLALATTLMAMQVADSMTVRNCPYRVVTTDTQMDVRPDHGFLGVRYVFKNGAAEVIKVLPGTPAEQVKLQKGDHLLSLDGAPLRSRSELQDRIYGSMPGTEVSLTVERGGEMLHVRTTLTPWPVGQY
jgi:S1-C subfamily serine protease